MTTIQDHIALFPGEEYHFDDSIEIINHSTFPVNVWYSSTRYLAYQWLNKWKLVHTRAIRNAYSFEFRNVRDSDRKIQLIVHKHLHGTTL